MLEKEYYLGSGDRTQVGTNVEKLVNNIKESDTKETIIEIMKTMTKQIPLETDSETNKKFRRTAEQIVIDGERNGCCDSSTLFVTLCRAKGIPAVQIITANVPALNQGIFSKGHFFSGCYLKETDEWVFIDSNKKCDDLKNGLTFHKFNPDSKYILNNEYYIFASVRDYSDFELNGFKIDSIKSMNQIHKMVYIELKQLEKLELLNQIEKLKKENMELKGRMKKIRNFMSVKIAKIPFIGKKILAEMNKELEEKQVSKEK